MDNNKVMIVGTGNVGASIAFAILNQRTAVNEIVLTDIVAEDAEGEAMDLFRGSDACIYGFIHICAELCSRLMYSRSVKEYILILTLCEYSVDSRSGSLGFLGYYGYLLTENTVHKCGLTNVRASYDCNKSCSCHIYTSVSIIFRVYLVIPISSRIVSCRANISFSSSAEVSWS